MLAKKRVKYLLGMIQFRMGQELGIASDVGNEKVTCLYIHYLSARGILR